MISEILNFKVFRFQIDSNSALSDAFSPDGTKIVAASEGCAAQIWDAESGQELKKMEGRSAHSAVFSPDGKKIATIDYGAVQIFDAESGKELNTIKEPCVFGEFAVFSPDGKKIFIDGYAHTGRIWDLVTLEKQLADVQNSRGAKQLIKAADLSDIRKKRGLEGGHLKDFVKFGSARLRDRLEEATQNLLKADEFDKANASAKIKAVEEEIKAEQERIAKTIFIDDFMYSTTDVNAEGDTSNFTMRISTEFTCSKIDDILFPMPDVTGKVVANNFPPGLYESDITAKPGGIDPSQRILLSVNGNTDSIRSLVRGSSHFRARIRFKNLQYNNSGISAEVLIVEIVRKEN